MKKIFIFCLALTFTFTGCGLVDNKDESMNMPEVVSSKNEELDESSIDETGENSELETIVSEEIESEPNIDVDPIEIEETFATNEQAKEALKDLCDKAMDYAARKDTDGIDSLVREYFDGEDAQTIIDVFSGFIDNGYPDYQYYIIDGDGTNFFGGMYNSITTGTYPDTKFMNQSINLNFSYIDSEWKFDYSDNSYKFMENINDKIYPEYEEMVKCQNCAIFEMNNYCFVDDDVVTPNCVDGRLYAIWQLENGDVKAIISLKNGTDEIRNIYGYTFTITDDSLGTVIDYSFNPGKMIIPNKGCTFTITIPAENIITGNAKWGQMAIRNSYQSR